MLFLTMTWPDGYSEDVSVCDFDFSDKATATLALAIEHITVRVGASHRAHPDVESAIRCDWKLVE